MKQITVDACQAFKEGREFKRGNTMVIVTHDKEGQKIIGLYLFGNLIAIQDYNGLRVTTAGWDTVTTRERLNGLDGVNVCKRKGVLYLNNEQWDGKATLIK